MNPSKNKYKFTNFIIVKIILSLTIEGKKKSVVTVYLGEKIENVRQDKLKVTWH